jgi:dTMP kinase
MVVLLHLDAETGLVRQEDPDRIGGEGVAFQAAVAAAFDDLAKAEPERFVVVDATAGVDTVWSEVLACVEERWVISSTA